MIAQVLLTVLLFSVLVYAWVEYRRSPLIAALSAGAALAGLYFVWVPSHSTGVAEFVGVGRGADLILYLWVCISLIVLLNLHLKLRTQHELITKLARTIAIANAETVETDAPRRFSAEREPRKGSPSPAAAGRHRSKQMHDPIS
jgi:hypothetical protein